MNVSYISNKEINRGEEVPAKEIRDAIYEFIKKDYPGFAREHYISVSELNKYRRLYLAYLIEQEKGELAQIDRDVMDAIKNNSILSENIQDEMETRLSFGQRIADKVASFGGSWYFITTFFLFIILWILLNLFFLSSHPYDPYPFILLNLILSCVAAIQAPIIMMSQNRLEQKDRIRAEHDYKINLKAELEIQLLSEKIDHLLIHQNKKLLAIQEVQTDYLDDLMKEFKEMNQTNRSRGNNGN